MCKVTSHTTSTDEQTAREIVELQQTGVICTSTRVIKSAQRTKKNGGALGRRTNTKETQTQILCLRLSFIKYKSWNINIPTHTNVEDQRSQLIIKNGRSFPEDSSPQTRNIHNSEKNEQKWRHEMGGAGCNHVDGRGGGRGSPPPCCTGN